MKRILLLSLLLVQGVVLCWGQQKVPREFQFAAIGGANLSSYTFAPSSILQNKSVGYTAGVGVRYIEEKIFGLQGELLLTRRGVSDRFENEYSHYKLERQFTYVELPLMAHIYFGVGQRNEISLDLGMKLAYYLGDGHSGNVNLDAPDDTFKNEIMAYARHGYAHHTLAVDQQVDYGIQAGLGYELKLNPKLSMQLQARYYFGLGDIFPNTKADVFETSSNQSIQLVLAVWYHHRIKIRKK